MCETHRGEEAVELRIHGIGGPSAESVLARADPAETPRPGSIAYSVWRSQPFARSSVRSIPQHPDVAIYHWAPLTSGSRFFALWPILLPFTLVNVAGWMLPRPAPTRRSRLRVALGRSVVTLLGSVLTVSVVFWLVWLGQVIALQPALADGRFEWVRAAGWIGSLAAIGVIVLAATHTAAGFERFPPNEVSEPRIRSSERHRLASPSFFRDGREHSLRWRWHVSVVVVSLSVGGWLVFGADDSTEVWTSLGTACALIGATQIGLLLLLLVLTGRGAINRVRCQPSAPALVGCFSAAAIGSLLVGGLSVAGAIVVVGIGGIPVGRATTTFDVFGWSVFVLLLAGVAAAMVRLTVKLDCERSDPPVLGSFKAHVLARVATIPRTLDVAVAAMATCLVFGGGIALVLRWKDAGDATWVLTPSATVTLGRLTVVALVGFMVLTVWRKRADAASLRRVGNVWDILTFWPRTYHPFAVRPYAERAVPELQLYLQQSRRSGEPLTVVAHSQGSVLAYAALAPGAAPGNHLGGDLLTGVRLVTVGSPICALHARWFPAHFGPEETKVLHDALTTHGNGWVNAYRYTDHIGRSMFVGDDSVDDHALADPPHRGRPLAGHRDYWTDPRVEALARLPSEPQPTGSQKGVR